MVSETWNPPESDGSISATTLAEISNLPLSGSAMHKRPIIPEISPNIAVT